MHAEIIAIGSELTSGAKLDTNSQWLSLQLSRFKLSIAHFNFHYFVPLQWLLALNQLLAIKWSTIDLLWL